MARQTAQINPAGAPPELEIRFGDANIGAYRVFRWDTTGNPALIGQGNNVTGPGISVGVPADRLAGAIISFEAIIQSARPGPGQSYAIFVNVHQDGVVAPGGEFSETGKLNGDGARSVIGFITFRHIRHTTP
jgi:hypothetical protein